MNSRQRFCETMAYGRPDRAPFFEEGIRDDVLEGWKKQGMPDSVPLSEIVFIDERQEIYPELDPHPWPLQWPKNHSQLDVFRQSLNPNDHWRLPGDWPEIVQGVGEREIPFMLRVHRGLYQTLGVSGWDRFEEVNILLAQEPQLVEEILEIQASFAAQLVERILSDVPIDAAIFSEPICGISGPLISPKMFTHFAGISYEPVLEVLRNHAVETIIFRTYANARILLPVVLEMGFNCLWACEVNPEAMDYAEIRHEYGRDLRLIGGIDGDVLWQGEEAIRREVEQKLPPLLEQGGFIPLADGRVRAVVPYGNYITYRRLLEAVVGKGDPESSAF